MTSRAADPPYHSRALATILPSGSPDARMQLPERTGGGSVSSISKSVLEAIRMCTPPSATSCTPSRCVRPTSGRPSISVPAPASQVIEPNVVGVIHDGAVPAAHARVVENDVVRAQLADRHDLQPHFAAAPSGV